MGRRAEGREGREGEERRKEGVKEGRRKGDRGRETVCSVNVRLKQQQQPQPQPQPPPPPPGSTRFALLCQVTFLCRV